MRSSMSLSGSSRSARVAASFSLLALLMLMLGPAAAFAAPASDAPRTVAQKADGSQKSSQGKKARGSSSGSQGKAKGTKNQDGNAGTSGDSSSPQPESRADRNSGGANGQCGEGETGPYCSTRDGSASQNGKGDGKANGKPCAGCVGKADNKNPKGQEPGGSDNNAGYECDRNQGIGKTNPAHTGCAEGSGDNGDNGGEGDNGEPKTECPDGSMSTEDGECVPVETDCSDEEEKSGECRTPCPEGQMDDGNGGCTEETPGPESPYCPDGEMTSGENPGGSSGESSNEDCVPVSTDCSEEQEQSGECRTPCPDGQMDDGDGGCTEAPEEMTSCPDGEMSSGAADDDGCVPVTVDCTDEQEQSGECRTPCPDGAMDDGQGGCIQALSPECPEGQMSSGDDEQTSEDCVPVTFDCLDEQVQDGVCRTPCPAGEMDDSEGGCTDAVICESGETPETSSEPCAEVLGVSVTAPPTDNGPDSQAGDAEAGPAPSIAQRAGDAARSVLPNTGAGWAVLIAAILGIAALVGGWRVVKSR